MDLNQSALLLFLLPAARAETQMIHVWRGPTDALTQRL